MGKKQSPDSIQKEVRDNTYMEFVFGYVITGTGEAVLKRGTKPNQTDHLYTIKDIDALRVKHVDDSALLDELERARVALCEDALLDYQPENTRFDAPQ